MKALILAPLALLAGCQHLNYQPPAGDNTAKVSFTSDSAAAQPVVCVPGKGFKATQYSLTDKSANNETMTELFEVMKKRETVTTTVSASPQSRIGVIYNKAQDMRGTRDRCRVALQFNAQAEQAYQAKFTHSEGQCGLSIATEEGKSVDAILVDWECP